MDDRNRLPPQTPADGKGREDAPDSGEIEWAEGFIPTAPAPGETRVDPHKISKPEK